MIVGLLQVLLHILRGLSNVYFLEAFLYHADRAFALHNLKIRMPWKEEVCEAVGSHMRL